jgi:YkoY family integral membrane protein
MVHTVLSQHHQMAFLGQRFHPGDIGTIGVLVVLEALLSADNALVLAMMVRHLPHKQRKQALLYGLGGAFALRTAAILLAAYIIQFWWLQAIGAVYLLYLPIKHFVTNAQGKKASQDKGMSFWKTVVYLNLVDLAFALDSVVAAVAVVDTVHHRDKLWVVVAGAVIGIVLLRFAASFFIRLLESYPVLDHVAYVLVGWAGLKLLLISGHSFEEWYERARTSQLPFLIPEMSAWVFWIGMGSIAIIGGLIAMRHPAEIPVHKREMHDLEVAIPKQIHGPERQHHKSLRVAITSQEGKQEPENPEKLKADEGQA